jgi:myo-inositol 2-dehydrogenase/D-chiro-inositol 1-dehydrogenase
MEPINIALLGAGRIGQVHAANLSGRVAGARLYAIADVSGEAAQRCAQQYGVAIAVDDYQRLLADPQVHAIALCTSTDTHARIITEAAQAGKHIFCEKPIAQTLESIDLALTAVEAAGVTLQIGFNRRFDANFRRARAAVVNGEIGRLERIHIISRDPAPPPISYVRVSGGLFLDMTIHDFDMIRFLAGDEVEELFVMADALVDPAIGAAGDVDTAVIMLRFKSGAIGTIENSRRAVYGYDQRVELFGSGGALRTENQYPNSALISDAQGVRRDLPYYFFLERYGESFAEEVRAFVMAIQQGTPVPVTGWDGRVPVVMALAAARSLRERRPVRLDEIHSSGG